MPITYYCRPSPLPGLSWLCADHKNTTTSVSIWHKHDTLEGAFDRLHTALLHPHPTKDTHHNDYN